MKPSSGTRKPYTGTSRSLVLALDIGTTFSGVSYAILEPGEVPKIHGVTRFPGQEHVAGNSKIPSIMYYDKHGEMKAAGAEADGASVLAQAEDEGWIKTELFKLRLRPRTMTLKMNGMRLSTLPRGKSAVEVFGDFLNYLFRCTRSYIIDTHANGQALWHAVEQDIQLVLSHPNGWEGAQQTKMRRAAVYGGLIPDTDEGKSRIRFVTEGEASLHACVLNGLAADVLSNSSGHGFIVADAGGGTLDISTYAIRGTLPLVIEEIAPPDCVFAGSVFVSRRARAFFEEKLKNSKYGTPDSLDHITKRFDETTKRLFRDSKELQFVPFGSPLDRDLAAGIRGGQLKLTGLEVAKLFEPSVVAAIESIKSQINASGGQVRSVWLVGGFAASPWLFAQLQEQLTPLGVTVSRPDTQTSKAVADGAIGFYCDHHVSARMSKFMYGVEYLREFDASDDDHVARKHRLFELPSGPKLLPDAFDCILARSVKVKESTVFSRKYCTEVTNLTTLSVFEVEIWCFRGGDVIPKWILRNAENFSTLCYVRADLSPLAGSAQPKQGRGGKTYWTIVFSIEIHFGLTEFKARIKWTDNGKTRYGPASIVYNEGGHRAEEDEPDAYPDDDAHMYSHTPTEKTKSYASSRAPSRDPIQYTSRSVSHSSHGPPPVEFPTAPKSTTSTRRPSIDGGRIYDYDRKPSTASRPDESTRRDRDVHSHSHSRTASIAEKGKQRERALPPDSPRSAVPERISERDRLANLSAKSTDSKTSVRSNATAILSAQLNSVWGASAASTVPSKQPTPLASPHVESAPFEVPTPRDHRVSTQGSVPPSPRDREIRPSSSIPSIHAQSPTPPSVPSVASSTRSLASKIATPAPASKIATPAPASKVASKVATPIATPKVATPQAPPVELVEVPPVAPPPAPEPEPVPEPTPEPEPVTPVTPAAAASAWGSKTNTVSGAATPTATPKLSKAAKAKADKAAKLAASKAPTPLATSKVSTPKTMSKVSTPVAERSDNTWGAPPATDAGTSTPKPPSPKVEPVPPAPEPAQEPTAPKPPTPEPVLEPTPPTPKVATPKPTSKVASPTVTSSKLPSPKLGASSKVATPKNSTSKMPSPSKSAAELLPADNMLDLNLSTNPVTSSFFNDTTVNNAVTDGDWNSGAGADTFEESWGFNAGETSNKDEMNKLWDTDKKDDTGGFSDFLTKGDKWSPGLSKNNSESGKQKEKEGEKPAVAPTTTSLFGSGGWGSGSKTATSAAGTGLGWGGTKSVPTPASSTGKGFASSLGLGSWGGAKAVSVFSGITDTIGTFVGSDTPTAEDKSKEIIKPQASPKPAVLGLPSAKPSPKATLAAVAAPAPAPVASVWGAKGKKQSSWGASAAPAWGGAPSAFGDISLDEVADTEKAHKEKEAKEKEEKEAAEKALKEKAEADEKEKAEKEKEAAEKAAQEAAEKEKAEQEAAEAKKKQEEEEAAAALKLDTTDAALATPDGTDDPPPTTAADTPAEAAEDEFPVHMTAGQKKKLKQQQAKEKKEKEKREKEEREKEENERFLADLAASVPGNAAADAQPEGSKPEDSAGPTDPMAEGGDGEEAGGEEKEVEDGAGGPLAKTASNAAGKGKKAKKGKKK